MTGSNTHSVKRAFVNVPFGQLHYRHAGDGPALLLLHASPGSSKQLEALITRLARDFLVLAPDMPGNGDSSPMHVAEPTVDDYAQATLAFMDALSIESAHIYGTHTGSCLGSELALLAPTRIGKLIQDGVVIFSAAERQELIEKYAHPFEPDLAGTQFLRAFMFCRDQCVFFPWYATDKAHRRDGGLMPAEALHSWVVEVLKASNTYHLAYRAAFAYPAEQRLPLVRHPVLCLAAEDDPLAAATESIVTALADGRYQQLPRFDGPDYLEALATTITDFLKTP